MRFITKLAFNLIGMALILGSADAQTGTRLAVITPENISDISQVAALESAQVGEIDWSSDGSLLAVGTSEGSKIYQAANPTAPPLQLAGGLTTLFDPTGDLLLSGNIVWDVTAQEVLFEVGPSDWQQFSPSGQFLLLANQEKERAAFTLWSTTTGEAIDTFEIITPILFDRAVYNRDESQYALLFQTDSPLYEGGTLIQVRSTIAPAEPVAEFAADYEILDDAFFSSDGQRFVVDNIVGGYGGTWSKLIVWDVATGNRIAEYDAVDYHTTVSPGHDHVAIWTKDTLLIVHPDTMETTAVLGLRSYVDGERVFSPDGQYMAVSYSISQDISEFGVAIWNAQPIAEVTEPIAVIPSDDNQYISSYTFSPDSKILAFSTSEHVFLWDVPSQTLLQILSISGDIHFTPDSDFLIVENQQTLQIWELSSGTLLLEANRPPAAEVVTSPTFLQAAYIVEDAVYIVDLLNNQETRQLLVDGYLGEVKLMDAEHNRVVFQSSTIGATATRIVNLETQTVLQESTAGHEDIVLSRDGMTVVYGDSSNGIDTILIKAIHEPNANSTVIRGRFDLRGTEIVLSPDGDLIYLNNITHDENSVRTKLLYSTEFGTLLAKTQVEANHWLSHGVFMRDNEHLVLGMTPISMFNDNSQIDIWNINTLRTQENPAPTLTLQLNTTDAGVVLSVMLSADETYMVVSINDAMLGDAVSNHYRVVIIPVADLFAKEGVVRQDDLMVTTLDRMHSPVFSSDEKYIATQTDNFPWGRTYATVLWDVMSGERIATMEDYYLGTFSPDSKLLLGYTSDYIAVWDVSKLVQGKTEPLYRWYAPNTQEVEFTPTGDRIYQQTKHGVITWGVQP